MPRYVRASQLPADVREAFAWHERPGALERLSPPFLPGRVAHSDGSLEPGSEVVLRLDVGPLRGRLAPRWLARHEIYDPPDPAGSSAHFSERQVTGPFAEWEHHHLFGAANGGRTVLTDDVTYRLPLGVLGERVAGRTARRQIARMFAYRHRVVATDLEVHAAARAKGVAPMHVAVTGATGMLGRALVPFLTTGGHRVTRVSRRPGPDTIQWDPDRGLIDADALRGVDAIVHLAGEPIADRRWTSEQRRRIHDSRRHGTRLLAQAIASLGPAGPRVLVSASGIHYYGDRGDEELSEASAPGDGFMAEVCRDWEQATAPAEEAGVRVAHLRTGIVQTPRGGALAKQLPLFRLGVGGRLGNGRQWVSWISPADVVGLYHHALITEAVQGPMNVVGPAPVTNAEHAKVLGRVLGRPAMLPVPGFGPRLVFGEMADHLAFESQRVRPDVALATGYTFRHPTLEGCLRDVLGKTAA